MLDRLDRCLKTLPKADRELILEYYVGEQQEKIQAAAKHCIGPWPWRTGAGVCACRNCSRRGDVAALPLNVAGSELRSVDRFLSHCSEANNAHR